MSLEKNLDLPEFILRMGNPSAREVYEFDDFRLDAGHLMLYYKDEEVALVPKAVELLVALVERRGQIISKDELLEKVWPDAIVDESNLFFYLSILRKALGTQKNGKPWFETLRRRGYRFAGDARLVPGSNGRPAPLEATPKLRLIPPITRSAPATELAEPEKPRSRIRHVVFAVTSLPVIVAAFFFTYSYFNKPPINSLAVMPFENETDDEELEYLSDGMTENLITNLSRIPELGVQARSSVARYKGSNVDARAVGAELNVDAVLYGRTFQRDDNVILRVELVDARTGNRLWEETYHRKKADLIQEEIARDLVGKLSLKLSGSTERNLAKNPHTNNADALRLFFKGQMYARQLTEPDIKLGIGFMQQAIDIDPSYAMAYAGIAEAYRSLSLAAEIHPDDVLPKAREAALKAVEIDDTLAEGHSALGSAAYLSDWNWAEAENHYLRALELDPNSASAHMYYADLLFRLGRREEWRSYHRRASELEPRSSFINVFGAISFLTDENPHDAIHRIRDVISSDPDFYFGHLMAGAIYKRAQMHAESLAEYRLAKKFSPDQTWSDCGMFDTLLKMGKKDDALAVLNRMVKLSKTRYVPPFHFALMYSQLGDKDRAFKYLEEAYSIRDPKLTFLYVEPRLLNLRSDPRYDDLLRRIGLPTPQTHS